MENSQSPAIGKKIRQINFFEALKSVIDGGKMTKLEWGNNAIYGVMENSILKLRKEDDKLYDWVLSYGDISGEDWVIL